MRTHITVVIVGVVCLLSSSASALDGDAELMYSAAAALRHSLSDRNAIPEAIIHQARAIAVFPAAPTEKAIREAEGVLTVMDSKPGQWKRPSIVAATLRLHVPAGRTPGDIILVAISRRGLDYLANAGAPRATRVVMSPGPVGWSSTINLKADIVGYARYRMMFAGIMAQQVVIRGMKNDPPRAIEWRECLNSVNASPEDRKTKSPESRRETAGEDLPANCFLRLR